MAISKEEIQKISELAHLRFPPEELEQFSEEFTRILTYLETIDRLDLTGVEPTAHVSLAGKAQLLRDDRLQPGLSLDRIMEQAPESAEGCFLVPKVIG